MDDSLLFKCLTALLHAFSRGSNEFWGSLMDASARVLYQKVFILATGSAAGKAALETFDSLVTPQVGYGKIAELVEAYMSGRVRELGRVEAFRSMLKQGFSVQLAKDEAASLLNALDSAGFNTWSHLYVAALNLGAPYQAALDQKASLALDIADRLTAAGKDAFYQGPAPYAATKTVLESVSTSKASFDLARANATSFVDALSDKGLRSAVVDGYIAGATVLADSDGDGVLDPGEWQGTSDAKGNFFVPASTAAVKLTASGGTDLLTNKPFTGLLSAPSGSSVVNPITSLVQAVIESGSETITLDKAIGLVNQAAGIPAGLNPLSYDPLVVLADPAANATERAAALTVQSSAIQVSNTISQLSTVIASSGSGVTKADAAAAVTQAITSSIVASGASPNAAPLDLSGSQFLNAVLVNSLADAGVTLSASQIGQVVQVAAASNAIADKATSITDLAKAASVAQDATTSLAAASLSGNFAAAVSGFTGAALETKQAAATVGEIVPGVVVPPPVVTPPPPVVTPTPPPPVTFTVAPHPSRADLLVLGGNATGPVTITLAAPSGGITKATFSRGSSQVSDVQVTDRWIQLPNEGSQVSMVIDGTDGPDLVRFDASGLSSAGLLLTGNLGGDLDTIGFRFTQSGQPLLQTERSSLQLINAEFAVFESNSGVDVGFPSTSSFKAFDSLTFSGGDFDLTGLGAGALADGVQILLVGSIA